MAYPYRARYRYPRPRRRTKPAEIAAGVAVAAVVIAAQHHGQVAGALRHGGAALGTPHVTRDAPAASGSQASFIRAVLADLGAPATAADIRSLVGWLPHEGTAAENNPMASTLREPGSTVFNYDGVQNYTSAAQGAQATAATLANGRYPRIVADLRSGRGLCGDASLAGEFLTWSGNGYSGVC